jgi:hypothetical protein
LIEAYVEARVRMDKELPREERIRAVDKLILRVTVIPIEI